MLSKENSEKRRIIQGLVNKYRSLEDELDEQQSEKESDLDNIHRIRELERALTAHRVQTTRLKSTIQQSKEDINLAVQIKQKLKNASTNFKVSNSFSIEVLIFKSVCKMLSEDARLVEPMIRKKTALAIFSLFHSLPDFKKRRILTPTIGKFSLGKGVNL